MNYSATISPCGVYRYRLGRRWGEGAGLVYVMLNPSTADANQDDPTIRRCIRFAQSNGFDAIDVVNLYAFRATSPADLKRAGYLVGPENDQHILDATRGQQVCLAWGANASGLTRPAEVLKLLRGIHVEPQCLWATRSGHPQHPLMLPASCRLRPFAPQHLVG